MLHKVQSAGEAALRRLPLLLTKGRVSPQRADVSNATGDRTGEPDIHLLDLLVRASHMHVHVESVLGLDGCGQRQSQLASGATRTPCEIDEQRLLDRHAFNPII